MREIKLHNSNTKIRVSDEAYEKVKEYRWYLHSDGKAVAVIDGELTWMHDFLSGEESDRGQDGLLDSETVYQLLGKDEREWVMAEAEMHGWSVPEFLALLVKGVYIGKLPEPKIPSDDDEELPPSRI